MDEDPPGVPTLSPSSGAGPGVGDPPVLGGHPTGVKLIPRWRAALALLLLSAYVLLPLLLSRHAAGDAAALPDTVRGVLLVVMVELGLFAVVFLVAWALARPTREELWLRRTSLWAIPRALGWSIALRLGLGILLSVALLAGSLLNGQPITDLARLRPKVEAIVEVSALRDPVYLAVMLTLVSFVLAGLREELWRAGMMSMLRRVWPRVFGGRLGPWLALLPVAVLFGAAHFPQGAFGMVATAILGIGLGAIMLLHRSLWDAVLAHGFFNAATFALLPLIADRLAEMASR